MRVLDVMQEIRSGTIGQFQVQRDEIDAMVVEDGHGYACIFRGEYVEVLPENLCEGCAGGRLIIDDQNGRFMVGCVGSESRRHSVTCIAMRYNWSRKSREYMSLDRAALDTHITYSGHSLLGFFLSTWV